mgnify:CR=1 FL=1
MPSEPVHHEFTASDGVRIQRFNPQRFVNPDPSFAR